MTAHPRRLIEVDLPIARISAHARREKSIRHGHISTLHIWWAQRPLAACRAVVCAALWPDPADPRCPQKFRDEAARLITTFARKVVGPGEKIGTTGLHTSCSPESLGRWEALAKGDIPLEPGSEAHQNVLRFALLDFIADFANWDNSTVSEYLETARALTQAAHEALGGEPGTRPLVVDPFAGGGSIPLEALRVGADAVASDLNPVAVLLNKVVLEYIPKYGQRLADEVRKWGKWVKEQAEKELAEFYPKDPDGATPIAYLWARTIRCEGTGCGAEVPLMRSLWLAKKSGRSVTLRLLPNAAAKRVDFAIVENPREKDVGEGTVKRGSATCPVCSFTTPVKSVREQLKKRRGGAADARLFCVVTTRSESQGRAYRPPTSADKEAVARATKRLEQLEKGHPGPLSLVPNERINTTEIRRVSVPIYGMETWGCLFTPRQALTLGFLAGLIAEAGWEGSPEAGNVHREGADTILAAAVKTCLAFVLDRCADKMASQVVWHTGREFVDHVFARQAIPVVWEFAEANFFSDIGWSGACEWVTKVIEANAGIELRTGQALQGSATAISLPNNSVQAVLTDPPYYYSVPYSNLSDFFYVWLRRTLFDIHPQLFSGDETPKEEECVQNLPHSAFAHCQKSRDFYEKNLGAAFREAARIAVSDAIGTVVFAHTDTAAWESLVSALVSAGWCVTASWPIDTEMTTRLLAKRQSTLSSSVHLVCRPRIESGAGDWRDVLGELPKRMHDWMPRLASEGVVGADAIFACLGPALEIFSRFARVEKANGEPVLLREYLEHVWAAVSREALSMIFRDADAGGLEPDARLTAMWLWTVGGAQPANGNGKAGPDDDEDTAEDEEAGGGKPAAAGGYTLEFDAARKIAQGLGVHLERCESLVEVKGDKARLLPVAERTRHLFGKEAEAGPTSGTRGKKKPRQRTLFDDLDEAEAAEGARADLKGPPPGTTALDRLHQAMILFGANRGELLKQFLLANGKEARFWNLARSLSYLYPRGTDERRWIEGVLARKKGLGL
jgi:adenine-specific DNA methylase